MRDSLLSYFPDVLGRFSSVNIGRQPDAKIEEMISKGAKAANLVFARQKEYVKEAAGSFVIGQRLCRQAAIEAGITTVPESLSTLDIDFKSVVKNVLKDLRSRFGGPLSAFAACDERPPPRGACLSLLWHLSRAEDAAVPLHEVRSRDHGIHEACFDWLLSSNLSAFFEKNPRVGEILHYNRDAAVLSAEDPQLTFYLRHLDWPDFARQTGHGVASWHDDDGPILVKAKTPAPGQPESGAGQGSAPLPEIMEAAPSPSARPEQPPSSYVLHLSDLHFGPDERQPRVWHEQLTADLQYELKIERPDAVIVSGDIVNTASTEEYKAANLFFQLLASSFHLTPQRIVIVPGNHDVSWDLSERAYTPARRRSYKGPLQPGAYIDSGEYIELRSNDDWKLRFQPFAHFYQNLRLQAYSLDYQSQATLHHFPEQNLLVLGLNSSWPIDHHYRARADIHPEALSRVLMEVRNTPAYASCTKLAVWHHPTVSTEEDRIKDTGFLERLAQAGFRIGLHGHIHKAQNEIFRYHRQVPGSGIELLGAGTFGASTGAWVPGYPLQYQVLQFTGQRLTVHTRRREEQNGAWKPDARWLQGPGTDPLPRYEIDL